MTRSTLSSDAAISADASSSGGEPVVEVRGLSKTYGQGKRSVRALDRIDLRIEEPGFYAIMGPSGSGKSTLLHLLAGLDRADEGELRLAGKAITKLDERKLTAFRRRDIGVVFQRFNLIATLTALENVALPAMLDGMPTRQRVQRAEALLNAIGLADRANHRPDALSGGEQQRVAIARALVFEPPILLADEPTGNLDSRTSEQIWSLLADLAEQRSLTVLMVTHEPHAAVHCQHVFLLRDGRIDDSFTVDGLDVSQLATRAEQSRR